MLTLTWWSVLIHSKPWGGIHSNHKPSSSPAFAVRQPPTWTPHYLSCSPLTHSLHRSQSGLYKMKICLCHGFPDFILISTPSHGLYGYLCTGQCRLGQPYPHHAPHSLQSIPLWLNDFQFSEAPLFPVVKPHVSHSFCLQHSFSDSILLALFSPFVSTLKSHFLRDFSDSWWKPGCRVLVSTPILCISLLFCNLCGCRICVCFLHSCIFNIYTVLGTW